MPKVSTIITTCNRERFVCEALRSVFNQTFNDIEIIVIDDGTGETTKTVLTEYMDRIRYIKTENVGRSEARNTGIRIAKGDYIAFLDDDDIWLPSKSEKQVRFLESNLDTGLVHTFMDSIDENGNILQKNTKRRLNFYIKAANKEYTYQRLTRLCPITASTIMVRSSYLQNIGFFDSEMESLEDWDFCLRFALKYHVSVVKEILARYRVHKKQSPNEIFFRGRIKISMKHLDLINSRFQEPFLTKIRYNFYAEIANAYYINLSLKLFRKFAIKALKTKLLDLLNLRLIIHLLISILPVNIIQKIRFIKNRMINL